MNTNYDEKDRSCHPSRDMNGGHRQIARLGRPHMAEGLGTNIDSGRRGRNDFVIVDCSCPHVCMFCTQTPCIFVFGFVMLTARWALGEHFCHCNVICARGYRGGSRGGAPGARAPPLTTKNEAPAPKFYKTEAQEWQF